MPAKADHFTQFFKDWGQCHPNQLFLLNLDSVACNRFQRDTLQSSSLQTAACNAYMKHSNLALPTLVLGYPRRCHQAVVHDFWYKSSFRAIFRRNKRARLKDRALLSSYSSYVPFRQHHLQMNFLNRMCSGDQISWVSITQPQAFTRLFVIVYLLHASL